MPMKFGRAYGALNQIRANFDEATYDGSDPTQVPLDFIDRREAERRAAKLLSTIGRDHAKAVADALRFGFSAGSWRIVSELQKQTQTSS